MQINDCVRENFGLGQYNEALLRFYHDNGATSGNINDAAFEFFDIQGILEGQLNDRWVMFLSDRGYEGSINDMMWSFFCTDSGSVGPVVDLIEWNTNPITESNEDSCSVTVYFDETKYLGADCRLEISGGSASTLVVDFTLSGVDGYNTITGLNCSGFANGSVLASAEVTLAGETGPWRHRSVLKLSRIPTFYDDFSGVADSTPLDDVPGWENISGQSANLYVTSANVVTVGSAPDQVSGPSGLSISPAAVAVGCTLQYSAIDITSFPIAIGLSDLDFIGARYTANAIQLWTGVGGVLSQVGSVGVPNPANSTLVLIINNDRTIVVYNGVEIIDIPTPIDTNSFRPIIIGRAEASPLISKYAVWNLSTEEPSIGLHLTETSQIVLSFPVSDIEPEDGEVSIVEYTILVQDDSALLNGMSVMGSDGAIDSTQIGWVGVDYQWSTAAGIMVKPAFAVGDIVKYRAVVVGKAEVDNQVRVSFDYKQIADIDDAYYGKFNNFGIWPFNTDLKSNFTLIDMKITDPQGITTTFKINEGSGNIINSEEETIVGIIAGVDGTDFTWGNIDYELLIDPNFDGACAAEWNCSDATISGGLCTILDEGFAWDAGYTILPDTVYDYEVDITSVETGLTLSIGALDVVFDTPGLHKGSLSSLSFDNTTMLFRSEGTSVINRASLKVSKELMPDRDFLTSCADTVWTCNGSDITDGQCTIDSGGATFTVGLTFSSYGRFKVVVDIESVEDSVTVIFFSVDIPITEPGVHEFYVSITDLSAFVSIVSNGGETVVNSLSVQYA